jgi:hypothetical protein
MKLNVPLTSLVFYIGLFTLAALADRFKLLLATSYVFMFYVGYFQNHTSIREALDGSPVYIGLYFGFGVIILILAVVTLLQERC